MKYVGIDTEVKFGDVVKSAKNGFLGIVVDIYDDDYPINVAVPMFYNKIMGGRTAFISFRIDELLFVERPSSDLICERRNRK